MLEKYQPDQELSNEEYKTRLSQGQVRLGELTWKLYQQKRSMVIAYEGWDAAGKGGNIRRLVEGLDPRGYRVHPIAAPKGDDASHHYLWRFWRRLPPKGEIAIFDRTWYGRVLVERVEGFATRLNIMRRLMKCWSKLAPIPHHGLLLRAIIKNLHESKPLKQPFKHWKRI